MTPEELDKVRVEEARRRWNSNDPTIPDIATGAARLARENWTPPEPEPVVDPDLLAFREWFVNQRHRLNRTNILSGDWDNGLSARAYLAGARMAAERERERAEVLVEYVEIHTRRLDGVGGSAVAALAKYRGERDD